MHENNQSCTQVSTDFKLITIDSSINKTEVRVLAFYNSNNMTFSKMSLANIAIAIPTYPVDHTTIPIPTYPHETFLETHFTLGAFFHITNTPTFPRDSDILAANPHCVRDQLAHVTSDFITCTPTRFHKFFREMDERNPRAP